MSKEIRRDYSFDVVNTTKRYEGIEEEKNDLRSFSLRDMSFDLAPADYMGRMPDYKDGANVFTAQKEIIIGNDTFLLSAEILEGMTIFMYMQKMRIFHNLKMHC